MTTYEFSSIIVAVAALALSILVPVFQFLFAKLQRPKLAIIPFAPPAEVADELFWRSGGYSIKVSVIYDAGERISATFRFSVSAEEQNKLKENDLVMPSENPVIQASGYYSAMIKLENP